MAVGRPVRLSSVGEGHPYRCESHGLQCTNSGSGVLSKENMEGIRHSEALGGRQKLDFHGIFFDGRSEILYDGVIDGVTYIFRMMKVDFLRVSAELQ